MKLPINRYSIFAIALTTTSITFLLLLLRSIIIVPAGYVGIIDSFNSVFPQTLKPGLSFKNPLSQVVKLSTRTQEIKLTSCTSWVGAVKPPVIILSEHLLHK